MYIKYQIEKPNYQKANTNSEKDLSELMECLRQSEETNSSIEKCLKFDPLNGVPSPPRGRNLLSFSALIEIDYPILNCYYPIYDLYPWIKSLSINRKFEVTYNYILERFAITIHSMSLQEISDDFTIEIEDNTTVIKCVKKYNFNQTIKQLHEIKHFTYITKYSY